MVFDIEQIETSTHKIMIKNFFIFLMSFILCATSAWSQTQTKKLTREQKKAFAEYCDSILGQEAKSAIADSAFTLEAYQVVFKDGQSAEVTSNTNFVRVEGKKAIVQVAFNVPFIGQNGLGGVTVDGDISNWSDKTDKRGMHYISFNVSGIGISARIDMVISYNSNKADITVSPNFNSRRLTLRGIILPNYRSRVYQGTTL